MLPVCEGVLYSYAPPIAQGKQIFGSASESAVIMFAKILDQFKAKRQRQYCGQANRAAEPYLVYNNCKCWESDNLFSLVSSSRNYLGLLNILKALQSDVTFYLWLFLMAITAGKR